MAMVPDSSIVRARVLVLGTAPSVAAVLAAWNGVKGALAGYDAAVAAVSLSSEGVSRSMDVDAAQRNVVEWLMVYDTVLAAQAEDAVEDADAVTLGPAMGHTVDHSGVILRF